MAHVFKAARMVRVTSYQDDVAGNWEPVYLRAADLDSCKTGLLPVCFSPTLGAQRSWNLLCLLRTMSLCPANG